MNYEKTIDDLQRWGCDTQGALLRTLGDKEFLVSLIVKNYANINVERLTTLIEDQCVNNAFMEAHKLKGSLGMLGLTPLYGTICTIVEVLRTGSCHGLGDDLKTLAEQKSQLAELLISDGFKV